MEELLDRLIKLLSTRQVEFTNSSGGEARALIAQQQGLYKTLGQTFREVPFSDLRNKGSVGNSALCQALFGNAVAVVQSSPPVVQTDDKTVVTSTWPILRDEEVQALARFVTSISGRRTAEEAHQYMFISASALAVEMPNANMMQIAESRTHDSERGRLLIGLANYVAAKESRAVARSVEVSLQDEIAKAKGHIDNHRAAFEREVTDYRSRLDALAAAAAQLTQANSETKDKIDHTIDEAQVEIDALRADFHSDIEKRREELQNFETTTREQLKLESVRRSWAGRFEEARLAFGIACGLLLAYLVITIGVAAHWGIPIVQALASIEQKAVADAQGVAITPATAQAGSAAPAAPPPIPTFAIPKEDSVAIAIIHQFGRLIVFSVPVFVWLWAGRALMRYFMRSMLLMDDARQRQTMLDTYFLLSEKGRADERDRPLVLWALFRQTPGHGPDGIEPPDFTEVINAGLKRAKLE
ncbi:hypothetical protein EDE05_102439 [Neorhizobium sp. R1-B]|uniref:hypothetical protein n=1 Tax=Neorhizobium sp. R1-B TaxID=2485162 RepID=UPI001066890D|nr:hypothetical protein [Neorhizobium sp. R1-B]TDX88462.1 hypothetical protein EDE05_102439 [Neorhizobium sp. R1-B]